MGWSLSWVAVRGASASEISAALGLTATTNRCGVAETPFCGAQLASDWYVVVADHDFRFMHDPTTLLTLASLGSDAVSCAIEEHAMVSEATAWHAGSRVWTVSHDGSNGGREVSSEGAPPASFEPLLAQALAQYDDAESSDVDFSFEVPIALAEALTDFRHDSSELQFTVLNPIKAAPLKKPWWRLF